jgi:hypothetical protein
MPTGLRRFHPSAQKYFITCSCYHRQPFLASARCRDMFLNILGEVRDNTSSSSAVRLSISEVVRLFENLH